MKVLITGGTGFLGSGIVRRLLERGDAVRVLARHRVEIPNAADVEFVQADIQDATKVAAACQGVDAVIHTAAREGIEPFRKPFYQTNVVGTLNVLEGCRAAGVSRLVATSSPSVIDAGKPIEGVDETYPYPKKHLSCYAASKRIAEEMVLKANSPDLMTCAIRPRLIWGPGDLQLIPRVIARAKKGKLRQIGDGTNMIDFTYIENAVDAHLLALDALRPGSPVPGSAYFISQGEPVNCWDWLNRVLEMVGLPPVKKRLSFKFAYWVGALSELYFFLGGRGREPILTRFLATQLAYSHWYNIDKARRELKYEPKVSTEEGVGKLRLWLNG